MGLSGNCTEAKEQEKKSNPDQLLNSLFPADPTKLHPVGCLDVLTYCLMVRTNYSLFTSCTPNWDYKFRSE